MFKYPYINNYELWNLRAHEGGPQLVVDTIEEMVLWLLEDKLMVDFSTKYMTKNKQELLTGDVSIREENRMKMENRTISKKLEKSEDQIKQQENNLIVVGFLLKKNNKKEAPNGKIS